MESHDNVIQWRDCIRAWYPDYKTKTYFVPPVVITRIPFDVVTVAGQSVLVPQCKLDQTSSEQHKSSEVKGQPTQESDTRDDLALQRVLFFLRELISGQNEPMFVISQLKFSGYLGEPLYAAAVNKFLRPHDLSKEYRRGDFDILIIHRHYGIITGEIKTVLSNQQQFLQTQQVTDVKVAKRVKNAIKQLNKSEVVLHEITKDLEPSLSIRKLLVLPYVSAEVLLRVVSNDEQLQQDLVTCLHAADIHEALQYCLLAENIASSGTGMVSDQQQKTWWSTFTAKSGNKMMTSDVYLDLLARFCGPATTISVYCPMSPRIEIRTEGQGVAVTGERMTLLVLTPEQISLLTRAPAKVLLTGPPGVGKTMMLMLMALTWLRQGRDVHLVSVWNNSLTVTRMIKHMIHVSMRNDPTPPSKVGSVHFHEYYFNKKETDVDKTINTLTATRGSHGPCVICDEFWVNDRHIARYHRFVTDLCTQLPNVCLWAASPYCHQKPEELQEEQMTTSLRCPPAVMSEVQKGISRFSERVHPYTTTIMATPCDGPDVIHLRHKGFVHVGPWPLECPTCGHSIAFTLKRLGLGVTDPRFKHNSNTTGAATTVHSYNNNNTNVNRTTACPSLKYRDIFVLTRSLDLRDDVEDSYGNGLARANGMVRGLRAAGIPVRVIRKGYESEDLFDMEETQSDMVTVTHSGNVSGLERKVVVWLPGAIPKRDDRWSQDELEAHDRIHAMSRCAALLVVVDVH